MDTKQYAQALHGKGVTGYTENDGRFRTVRVPLPEGTTNASGEEITCQRFYLDTQERRFCRLRDGQRTGRLIGPAETLWNWMRSLSFDDAMAVAAGVQELTPRQAAGGASFDDVLGAFSGSDRVVVEPAD